MLDKAIHQFYKIEAAGHMPEFTAEVQKIFTSFSLGDYIEVATKRDL